MEGQTTSHREAPGAPSDAHKHGSTEAPPTRRHTGAHSWTASQLIHPLTSYYEPLTYTKHDRE